MTAFAIGFAWAVVGAGFYFQHRSLGSSVSSSLFLGLVWPVLALALAGVHLAAAKGPRS